MAASTSHIRCLQTQLLLRREEERAIETHRVRFILPLLLFMALAFQLWVRIASISKGYEVEELRREALRHDNELRDLKLEYALVSRPSRLAQEAKRRLAMTELAPQHVRKVVQ